MRLSLHLARLQHRMLRFCSKSYRDHDVVVADRERWRRECVVAGNSVTDALARARQAEESAAELRERLKLAIEAQQGAAEQLIAERALRQSAEERAERHHVELTEALKSSVDWLARGLYHQRPMFGVGAPPDEPRHEPPVDISVKKPMARRVAQEQTNGTLKEMLDSIRGADGPPVGPEFTTQ